MARIKRDNAAVEQLMSEAKQLQGRVKQLEAQQAAGAHTAPSATAAATGGTTRGHDDSGQQDEATKRCVPTNKRKPSRLMIGACRACLEAGTAQHSPPAYMHEHAHARGLPQTYTSRTETHVQPLPSLQLQCIQPHCILPHACCAVIITAP